MKPDAHTQNTESKLSPEVAPFVPKIEALRLKPEKDTVPPGLTLPNPYVDQQCLRRTPPRDPKEQSSPLQTSGWKTITRDNQQSNTANKHGYSNSRRSRGTSRGRADSGSESSTYEQLRKASRPSTEPMTKRPQKTAKKEDTQGSRSATHSAWQKDTDTFEVKLSDFPELGFFAPQKSALPAKREPQPDPTLHCQDPPSSSKNALSRKEQTDSFQSSPAGENEEIPLTSTRGQPVLHSPGLPGASWASVASLPPVKTIPRKTSSMTSPQKELQPELESEVSEKKSKKKKKKKSKQANDDTEVEKCDTPTIEQKPPKFQDEEEFPELGLATASPGKGKSTTTTLFSYSNMAKRHKENSKESAPQRDASALRAEDQKDQTTARKPPPPAPPTETKKAQQKTERTSGKKSKGPVQLDLGNMLAVLEQKQQSQKSKQDTKPIILSVGGALPVVHKDPSAQKKHPKLLDKVAHNPLDSTSPLVKKGKQREVPKAKKPTPLKRIILKEREERKQNRLLEEQGLVPPAEDSGPADNPTEDLQEAAVSEEDLTGADRQTPDSTDPEQYEGAHPEEPEPEPEPEPEQEERDTGETAEESAPLEACLPSRPKIHSRKFRDYCSQVLSKDVDECVTVLLKELVRFQDRLYQKDPMKARMKRRLVMGLREVLKHLKLRKVKCVIISPNCERIQSKGGLDEALHTIIDTCREQNVPFVFALSRKALGRCVNKAVPVSLVGIFNYDGAQDHYHKMIELSSQARKAYEVMIANVENSVQEQQEIPDDEQNLGSTPDPLDPSETEEPEYIKIWKKMLEKDCNHQFLNFENGQ
ncbi:hypothetical protein AAFF_G00425610 [Aldrovandia affinis]|uniref:Ribosomal protein eL8/eL30/eS12/Gadd45 domain-containing protein n=1 Tax=Aldrovandia affinis TaxID=143900 RepID=A0AAD7T8K0_9TELE|nr:hypothetical protein AAFF_G00425610 [Aldrovandia affinis]